MNSKLALAGAGLFGFGSLLSWAVTADFYEKKTRVLDEVIHKQDRLIADLLVDLAEAPAETEAELQNGGEFDPPDWEPATSEAVEAAAEQRISQLKQYAEETAQIVTDIIPTEPAVETVTEPDISPEGDDVEEEYDEAVTNSRRRDLRSLIDQYTANPDDRDQFTELVRKDVESAKEVPPFHITREQFANDELEGDDYEKITLTYYERDRVLVSPEEEVEDIISTVGWQNLNRFGDESGDPDVVFVRNRRLLSDFEVIREVDDDPPIHIRYGMDRETFLVNKAAGVIKFRDEDSD